jgi:DNA-binding response OmpR family regulator
MEKMLIVDDNGELRKILMLTFSYGKYRLFQAENGEQALDLARREVPDVIVLDIMMPGMDGLEVCRKIRAIPALANSYVILLTALGLQSDRQAGMAAGANYYMVKPFLPTDLIMLIEGVRTGKKSVDEMQVKGPAIAMRFSDGKS